MGTFGNLEIVIDANDIKLTSSANMDGYEVLRAIPRFANFIESYKNPNSSQYKKWFNRTSRDIFKDNLNKKALDNDLVDFDVSIDAPRKIILYSSYITLPESFYLFEKGFKAKFLKAYLNLEENHNYELIYYRLQADRKKKS